MQSYLLLALALVAVASAQANFTLYAINGGNVASTLVFSSNGTFLSINTGVPITGLNGDVIVTAAATPTTSGQNGYIALTSNNNIYALNFTANNATFVAPITGCNPTKTNPQRYSDFNPTTGLLTVVTIVPGSSSNLYVINATSGACTELPALNGATTGLKPAGIVYKANNNGGGYTSYLIDVQNGSSVLYSFNLTSPALNTIGTFGGVTTGSGVGALTTFYDVTGNATFGTFYGNSSTSSIYLLDPTDLTSSALYNSSTNFIALLAASNTYPSDFVPLNLVFNQTANPNRSTSSTSSSSSSSSSTSSTVSTSTSSTVSGTTSSTTASTFSVTGTTSTSNTLPSPTTTVPAASYTVSFNAAGSSFTATLTPGTATASTVNARNNNGATVPVQVLSPNVQQTYTQTNAVTYPNINGQRTVASNNVVGTVAAGQNGVTETFTQNYPGQIGNSIIGRTFTVPVNVVVQPAQGVAQVNVNNQNTDGSIFTRTAQVLVGAIQQFTLPTQQIAATSELSISRTVVASARDVNGNNFTVPATLALNPAANFSLTSILAGDAPSGVTLSVGVMMLLAVFIL